MTRGPSSRRESLVVLQAVLLGLLVAAYAVVCWSLSSQAFTRDFVQFYSSAQSWRAGESVYKPLPLEDFDPAAGTGARRPEIHPNLNPPLMALALVPLTFLGLASGYLAWTALSLVMGLCACVVIWRELNPDERTPWGLVWLWIALLAYYPTYTAITMGQVTFSILLTVAGAWVAARRGHDRVAGMLVGLAVSMKLFAVLLVVFFVLHRRWRVVAWSLATAVAAMLVTLPFVGVAAYRDYFTVIRSVTWFGNNWNASYSAFFTRILGGSENVPLFNLPALAHGLTFACSGASVLWLAWRTWPRPAARESLVSFDLGYGLTLTVMLLVSPLGWMYYFPLLMLPGYVVWSLTRRGRMRSVRRGLFVAWGLSTIPIFMVRATDVNDPLGWFTGNSVYFYALFILAVVLSAALMLVESKPGSAPVS